MAAFIKFNCVARDLASGVHQLQTGTTHVFKVMLTNTLPVAANSVKADIAEIAAGSGYTAGGVTCAVTSGALTGGTFKLVLGDPSTITATGGSIATFRYAVLYNDTPTSPAKPLLGAWDYGSAIALADTQQFVVDFDATNGVLTLT